LQPEHIIALEEAIVAYKLGQFDDAEAIFEQRLPPSHTLPILALERSNGYEMQGLHRKSLPLYSKTLSEWNQDGAEPERRLLCLLLRRAEAFVDGTLYRALEEARKMPDFLADLPLDKFTDIDVRPTSKGRSPVIKLTRFGR
jgi:tetratricopeptide (TPR) repeat protein